MVAGHDAHTERLRAGPDDGERLRVAVLRDEEHVAPVGLLAEHAPRHHHRLGGGGRFVEHRRVCDLEAGQVEDQGLEVEQRFEATLRDLGLVGRVLGVPARVLEHVAQDHRGRDRAVVAHAEVAAVDLVLVRDAAQVFEKLGLAARGWEFHVAVHADGVRDRGPEELVDRRLADGLEHRGDVGFAGAEVAVGEGVGAGEELVEGVVARHGSVVPSGRGIIVNWPISVLMA